MEKQKSSQNVANNLNKLIEDSHKMIVLHMEACEFGFYTYDDGNCERCREPYFGYRCGSKCACRTNERCHHKVGCVQVLLSTEAVTTDDHTEGINEVVHLLSDYVSLLHMFVGNMKYLARRYTIHPNVSRNHAHQGEIHEYEGVDDGCLNQESSIYDVHRARSSGSSTRGSGICGIDSDGYLNPYRALKSIEIQMEYA
ncbi:LAMC1 [Mytilus coruscus]|uniref:LAMC1 n=1 Tax=Mytilus coruscus TaxID=42192 RepID=A0A6J8DGJ2_MYTCO|nr:LAMC1 [Mytilus coruscus]